MSRLEHHWSLADKGQEEDAYKVTELKRQLAKFAERVTQLEKEMGLLQAHLDIECIIWMKT